MNGLVDPATPTVVGRGVTGPEFLGDVTDPWGLVKAEEDTPPPDEKGPGGVLGGGAHVAEEWQRMAGRGGCERLGRPEGKRPRGWARGRRGSGCPPGTRAVRRPARRCSETRGERAPPLLTQGVCRSRGSLPRSSWGRLPPAARAGPGRGAWMRVGHLAVRASAAQALFSPQVGSQPSLLRHGEAGLPAQQQRPPPQHHRHGHLRLPDGWVLPAGPGRAGTLRPGPPGLHNLAPCTGSKW